MPCAQCKRRITVYSAGLRVLNDSAPHMDAQKVREDLWYHTTTTAHWIEQLIEGETADRDFLVRMEQNPDLDTTVMVHLGTVDAALDRAGHRTAFETVYMYVVRLKPGVEIAQVVKEDTNDSCPNYAGFCERDGYSTEVTRYVNMYESPGSISLLANRKSFEVVDRIRLQ